MKRIFIIIIISFSALSYVCAQVPQAINYQATLRDSIGNPISNDTVGVKLSVQQDSIGGNLVYSESHIVVTNSYGLIIVAIGLGNAEYREFDTIYWGGSDYFLKTEIDPNGGNDYTEIGTTQLLSVPYALKAQNANSLTLMDTNGVTWNFSVNPFGEPFSTPQYPGDINCGTSIVNARDGQVYPIVQVGIQCWLTKNMNIGDRIDGSENQTDNDTIEKYCYDNLEENCDIYGGLYQWDETMQYLNDEGVQGICPSGWHVPSGYDWNMLIGYLGGEDIAGGKLKEADTIHWDPPNVGATNESGFTGLPGGSWSGNSGFGGLGANTGLYSSTEKPSVYAYRHRMLYNTAEAYLVYYFKTNGYSVRCLRD